MKTTIIGLLSAGALVLQAHLQAGRSLDDWKTWLPAVFIAVLGFLAGDKPANPEAKSSGSSSGLSRYPVWILLFTLAFALCFSSVSCTGVTAGLTGQSPPSTPVKRLEGGTPVNLATRDLVRAETSPEGDVWGLYNVGNVARATEQLADSGK